MMSQTQVSWILKLAGVAAVALALGPAPISAGSNADVRERPYGGSCNAAVTQLTEPGVFPEVLQVDLDCLLKHLGRATGAGTTTVVPAGAPVGSTLPIVLTSETTYEAANGDLLYQTFSGTGTVNTETLDVEFDGMEILAGGTGRFVDAVGFAHSVGSASFVTNTGFLTTTGRLAY